MQRGHTNRRPATRTNPKGGLAGWTGWWAACCLIALAAAADAGSLHLSATPADAVPTDEAGLLLGPSCALRDWYAMTQDEADAGSITYPATDNALDPSRSCGIAWVYWPDEAGSADAPTLSLTLDCPTPAALTDPPTWSQGLRGAAFQATGSIAFLGQPATGPDGYQAWLPSPVTLCDGPLATTATLQAFAWDADHPIVLVLVARAGTVPAAGMQVLVGGADGPRLEDPGFDALTPGPVAAALAQVGAHAGRAPVEEGSGPGAADPSAASAVAVAGVLGPALLAWALRRHG